MNRRISIKYIVKFFYKIIITFIVLSILWVVLYRFLPIPFTATMLNRKIEGWGKSNNQINYTWVSYEEVSPNMPLALVASEDQNFPKHFGFEFESIKKAYNSNKKGGKIRGGSTISQQVAKNVFLWQGRSYLRKGLEAYFTILIEIFWSKKRILEVYMNVAETGIRTFGVEEGCKRYYNHGAKNMSSKEAAKMAAIFPDPQRREVNNGYKTHWIMKQMRSLGVSYLSHL